MGRIVGGVDSMTACGVQDQRQGKSQKKKLALEIRKRSNRDARRFLLWYIDQLELSSRRRVRVRL